ncbi:MAG: cytochrome C oxidase subunit IV family protein [Flavobacteriaceae bacterium]|nr:cytochrome C oxidase subunit IV family protein [Flavobacteriaceae bacterium]
MQKKDIYTLVLLILLTITTAFFSNLGNGLKVIGLIILILSGIKFIAVAFQFMELNKAHNFWKGLVISFLTLFIGIIYAVL